MTVTSSRINIKSFGAKGDGVTDDSNAFDKASAYIESLVAANVAYGADPNKVGRVFLEIPAGAYVIVTPEVLLRGTFVVRSVGLVIQGEGKAVTQILFKPATTGKNLMNNNDAWLTLQFRDIEFNSNDNTATCLHSQSSGGAQNYTFSNVGFSGTWNNGLLFRRVE